MKVLVLVLGARVPPYPMLAAAIEKTWASVEVEDVSVVFYYGGDRLVDHGRVLELPVGDDLPNAGRKTLAAFAHVLASRDFDVLFRTNCSSYVDLSNLRRYAASAVEPHRHYAGVGSDHEGIPFASGSGYFVTRDLVELVVEQRDEWNHDYLDDVALGGLLAAHGVERRLSPRVDFRSVDDARDVDTTQFHFRCKTETPGRRGDVELMRRIHRAFRRARGDAPRIRLPWDRPRLLRHLAR